MPKVPFVKNCYLTFLTKRYLSKFLIYVTPFTDIDAEVEAEAMVEAESAHGQLPLGKALYAWYKGISDSTCDVERLIKTVKQHIKVKHADIGSLLLRDAVTIDAFGPQKKEDLATRSVCPDSRSVHLVPTDILKRCHALWVMHFGRRYCVNSMARSDKGSVKEKTRYVRKCCQSGEERQGGLASAER